MANLTYKGKQFYMDGEPFVVISGAMHYFRIPREYWRDRLLKLKECGFNCVETYTCWNLHEPREGEFDFSGMLDIAEYVRVATEVGLYVILRPGPYICAEWELGGLPAWLLTYKDMDLRCMDETYLSKVRRYYNELLERVRPYFASNGGNIVMLQVENEYGSYGNDKDYLNAILDIYKDMGIESLFFTSDGPSHTMLNGGTLPGILSVANFGSHTKVAAQTMFEKFPHQPFMCGEFWNGWFEHWGEKAHYRNPQEVIDEFKTFMDNDWSINVYMFHGGTNFGFMNGANCPGEYQPTITSYDYGAFLTEAGDRTETYYKIRDILVEKYGDKVPALTATETPKKAYGKVTLTESAKLFDNIDNLSTPVHVVAPKHMEDIGQSYGYVLYRTTIKGPMNGEGFRFHYTELHDRAHTFIDGEYKATYYRNVEPTNEERIMVPLSTGKTAQLDVLVEYMGRVNYGRFIRDKKGMLGMSFGNQFHFGWDMYALPMDNLDKVDFKPLEETEINCPTFLRGELNIEGKPQDTFLRLDGFKKGFVTINGFNLGRYWEIGPTKTLYVPAPMLKEGKNEIIVFESDGATSTTVEFFAEPDLGR